MENQNIRKSRGRPKTKTEDENLIALQNRQHNYYLNYKNKKHTKNVIDDEICVIKENDELDNNDFELSNHTKKLNELIDEVIIIMNKMKSLN